MTYHQLLEIGNALATMDEPNLIELLDVNMLVNRICSGIEDCTNEMRELVANIIVNTPIVFSSIN